MSVDVIFPKVSLEATSGRIDRWLVTGGTVVEAGQVLFEIDNDKAAVEVEAPAAGRVELAVPEGHEVPVGAVVARILAAAEVPAPPPVAVPVAVPVTPPTRAEAVATGAAPGRRPPNPTPLARRIARDHRLDLRNAHGSGPGGRVQKSDVLALIGAGTAPAAAPHGRLNAKWLRQGDGVPLVLLHGFASDLNSWRGMFAGTGRNQPVLALDLPCHGDSPRETPASLEAIAAMVEERLATEISGPFVLAGHSFGGAVATRVARRGAVQAAALCLFAPAGLGPRIDAEFIDGILRAKEAASLRPWLEMLVHVPEVISPAFVTAVQRQRTDAGLTEALRAFAGRFMPDGTQTVSINADLAALEVPVRVVFGRQDRILDFAATRGLPGNVALHAVSDCGHMPQLEHPALARRILSELGRLA